MLYKTFNKVYFKQCLEAFVYVSDKAHTYYDRNYSQYVQSTHLSLITSASAGTQYFAAMSVLNKFFVYDLNGLDAYTLCTVYE